MRIPYVTDGKKTQSDMLPACVSIIKDDEGCGVDTEVCCGRINTVID